MSKEVEASKFVVDESFLQSVRKKKSFRRLEAVMLVRRRKKEVGENGG